MNTNIETNTFTKLLKIENFSGDKLSVYSKQDKGYQKQLVTCAVLELIKADVSGAFSAQGSAITALPIHFENIDDYVKQIMSSLEVETNVD